MAREGENQQPVHPQEDSFPGLRGIRHLLSHLHGEITVLEATRRRVLLTLRQCSIPQLPEEKRYLAEYAKFEEAWKLLLARCEAWGIADVEAMKRESSARRLEEDVFFRLDGLLRKFESGGSGAADAV